MSLSCGNGFLDAGEECDLGSRTNGVRTCSKNCMLLYCGDQIVSAQAGEECEPELVEVEVFDAEKSEYVKEWQYVKPSCGKYCLPPVCADDKEGVEMCTGGCRWRFQDKCPFEILPLTEEMIKKMLGASSSRTSLASSGASSQKAVAPVEAAKTAEQALQPALNCGNGNVDTGEACDQGTQNSNFVPNVCRSTCLLPTCGDGVTDTLFGEVCDQGSDNSNAKPNTCRLTCTPPICGDGVIDSNEECDGGDGCNAQCRSDVSAPRTTLCGNRSLDPGEDCDDGNMSDGDGCTRTCTNETSICGNNILNVGEECDDGNIHDNDGCSRFCVRKFSSCGNGEKDLGEECDTGEANSDTEPGACRTDCTIANCGDAVLDDTEECDDGNDNDGDNCTSACELPSCGDSEIQEGEQCDDGNILKGDGCSNICKIEATSDDTESKSILFLVFVISSVLGGLAGSIAGFKWGSGLR